MDRPKFHQTPSREPRKGSSIPGSRERRPNEWLPSALRLHVTSRLSVLLAAVLLLVAACQPATGVSPTPSTTATATPILTTSPSASPAPIAQPAFPLAVRDDEGTLVTLAALPQRIVSLTPAVTETLFALGAGPRVVAGTDADDYPAEAKSLPHVATFQGVIMEKLVAAKPDLVIAGGNGFTPGADIKRMRALGVLVLVVYAGSMPDVLSDLRLVGEVSGTYPAAVAMADLMQRRVAAIGAATAARASHPRVFYEIGYGPDIYGPADGFFVVDLIALAGGKAITTGDVHVFSIPLERLIAADPEVIVLGDGNYGVTPAAIKARPGWGGMTAVKDGAVRPVDDIIVTRPGPRLADGLIALALAIDPTFVVPADDGTPVPISSLAASPSASP